MTATPSVIGISLIGCGRIARSTHLPTLRRLPHVRLTALADPDPQALAAAARSAPDAKPVPDYRAILEDPDTHAVIICTPNHLHAPIALAALQADKHIYLEKPVAVHPQQVHPLIEAASRPSCIAMIGFNYRFHPLHVHARQLLTRGTLGPITAARTSFMTPPRDIPPWKKNRATGGGALMDLASHHLDLVEFLFNQPIVEVSAALRSQRSDHDTATVAMRMRDGFTVQSLFSFLGCATDRFEIVGRDATLTYDRLTDMLPRHIHHAPRSAAGKLRQRLSALPRMRSLLPRLRHRHYDPSFKLSLEHFVQAIRQHRQPSPDLHDGLRSLELVCAIEKSAQRNQPVQVAPRASSPAILTEAGTEV